MFYGGEAFREDEDRVPSLSPQPNNRAALGRGAEQSSLHSFTHSPESDPNSAWARWKGNTFSPCWLLTLWLQWVCSWAAHPHLQLSDPQCGLEAFSSQAIWSALVFLSFLEHLSPSTPHREAVLNTISSSFLTITGYHKIIQFCLLYILSVLSLL